MKSLRRSRDCSSKAAALVIILAFVVLLTGLSVAYFSRTTTDRQLAQSSYNDTSADLLARSALDIVANDFKQELITHPSVNAAATDAIAGGILPQRYTPVPALSITPIPNLIRQSFSGDPTGRTSSVNSGAVSQNGRSISTTRWNSHYLIPRGNSSDTTVNASPTPSFTPPDWVLITSQGPNSAPAPSAVIGRYAFAAYDEGGLLDMNLAGYPTWTQSGGGGSPNVTPTPWPANVGRKGIITFADLTALPAAPTTTFSQSQINNIVGWRNFATTGQSNGSFGSPSFKVNDRVKQDNYGSYLLDFGDPPYPTPCPTFPFTTVDPTAPSDQAVMTRQQLLKLLQSVDSSGSWQKSVQYMGTYSRERNQPARDWNRLNNRLPDRFDLGMLGMVKPNPPNSANGRGRGQGHQNGGNFKGRGHYKGAAGTILTYFGLVWVPASATVTDPHNILYWGHWLYEGTPPIQTGNPHIPVLRGGQPNDFFQLLDFCVSSQANANQDDATNVATILGLGASLIDQYDNPGTTPPGRMTWILWEAPARTLPGRTLQLSPMPADLSLAGKTERLPPPLT
jgi:hypothetical protein